MKKSRGPCGLGLRWRAAGGGGEAGGELPAPPLNLGWDRAGSFRLERKQTPGPGRGPAPLSHPGWLCLFLGGWNRWRSSRAEG